MWWLLYWTCNAIELFIMLLLMNLLFKWYYLLNCTCFFQYQIHVAVKPCGPTTCSNCFFVCTVRKHHVGILKKKKLLSISHQLALRNFSFVTSTPFSPGITTLRWNYSLVPLPRILEMLFLLVLFPWPMFTYYTVSDIWSADVCVVLKSWTSTT